MKAFRKQLLQSFADCHTTRWAVQQHEPSALCRVGRYFVTVSDDISCYCVTNKAAPPTVFVKVIKNAYCKSTSISKGIIVIIAIQFGTQPAAIELGRCTVTELSPDQQVSTEYVNCQLDTKLPLDWGSGVGPTFTSSTVMSQGHSPKNGRIAT
jgi:hypothetical protein